MTSVTWSHKGLSRGETPFALDSWRSAQRAHHPTHDLNCEGQSTSGNSTHDSTLTLQMSSIGKNSICNTEPKGLPKGVTSSYDLIA